LKIRSSGHKSTGASLAHDAWLKKTERVHRGDPHRKWIPPHATTTAYGRQPIVNPIVDGRMFFRGGNGIYCYDLRAR